jgi:hypothetical protein
MINEHSYALALEKFREAMAIAQSREVTKKIIDSLEIVFARYQPAFRLENIHQLSEETFRSFLYFENNQHWSGLYRHAGRLTADMDLLRKTLSILLDPNRPLAERYNEAVTGLKGLGKAVASAILLINSPDKYGIWNNTSRAALKALDIKPEFPYGSHRGQRYEEFNKVLLRLAKDLEVDLWTLDTLMWVILPKNENEPAEPSSDDIPPSASEQKFGLEKHLHNFLFDNWDHTSLGKEWELYRGPDDDETGSEYATDIGWIDLLARHRKKSEWLVIELKRGQSSDETVGQVSRYMGWVKHNLAQKGDTVRGLIISRGTDLSLAYAIRGIDTDKISVQNYEVEFHLKPVSLDIE